MRNRRQQRVPDSLGFGGGPRTDHFARERSAIQRRSRSTRRKIRSTLGEAAKISQCTIFAYEFGNRPRTVSVTLTSSRFACPGSHRSAMARAAFAEHVVRETAQLIREESN